VWKCSNFLYICGLLYWPVNYNSSLIEKRILNVLATDCQMYLCKTGRCWFQEMHTHTLMGDLPLIHSCHKYRVSQEECARLRESVHYVKVYLYNPKHLYPKLNGYGDNGLRKVGASCGSRYCNLHSWCVARHRWWPWEWNVVLIVPAWLLVACTGVGSAM